MIGKFKNLNLLFAQVGRLAKSTIDYIIEQLLVQPWLGQAHYRYYRLNSC